MNEEVEEREKNKTKSADDIRSQTELVLSSNLEPRRVYWNKVRRDLSLYNNHEHCVAPTPIPWCLCIERVEAESD